MSSLGWLDLQQYLEANREGEQQRADADAAMEFRQSEDAVAQAQQGNSMPYSQYLAQRRVRDATGGSAPAGDRFLRANVQTASPEVVDVQAIQRQRAQRQAADASYWDAQRRRNEGLAAEETARRKAQDDGVTAARKAIEERAGGPGYAGYSRAVEKSYTDMQQRRRPRGAPQVRVISDEEYNRYGG